MKRIKYQVVCGEINHGTEENPIIEQILIEKLVAPATAENEEIAKREAYNGEYTIEDDGEPDPTQDPTTDEVLNALLGVSE